MKAVYLNTWGGKIYEPLMEFLKKTAADSDFFCLQEVFDSPEAGHTVSWGGRADILASFKNIFTDFALFYSLKVKDFDGDHTTEYPLLHGNAIFVRSDIPVLSSGDIVIAGKDWQGPGTSPIFPHTMQYVRISHHGTPYTIINVHGVAYPGTKLDTDVRLEQSQRIAEFLAGETGEKILGGDFNLMPDTESVRMIERAGLSPHLPENKCGGMRNLITEYKIASTRSALSHAQYPEDKRQYFADFVFVSAGVGITNFAVPQIEISDHLPLMVEWI